MSKSHLEVEFATAWQYYYPHLDLHSEHKFHPKRRFRFDFAHLPTKTAIEIQGGIWTRGKAAHSSGSGVQRDCHKQCLASSLGWLVFPLSEAMIRDRDWLDLIAKAISDRPIYLLTLADEGEALQPRIRPETVTLAGRRVSIT